MEKSADRKYSENLIEKLKSVVDSGDGATLHDAEEQRCLLINWNGLIDHKMEMGLDPGSLLERRKKSMDKAEAWLIKIAGGTSDR